MGVPSELAAADYVERYCNIRLKETDCIDHHVGKLPKFTVWGPLSSAPTITNLLTGCALTADDFVWTVEGQLLPLRELSSAVWKIEYTAGYATVPTELEAIISALAAEMEQEELSGGIESERLGDYSYASGAASSEQLAAKMRMRGLDLWRRLI